MSRRYRNRFTAVALTVCAAGLVVLTIHTPRFGAACAVLAAATVRGAFTVAQPCGRRRMPLGDDYAWLKPYGVHLKHEDGTR